MKNDSIITKIKILTISILIAGTILSLFILYDDRDWEFEKIFSLIFISLHSFFFPPTIKYIINWFKALSFEEGFYAGFRIGYYGIGFLIIIDPVVGIMYYFNKKFRKNINGNNVIIVGFYIN